MRLSSNEENLKISVDSDMSAMSVKHKSNALNYFKTPWVEIMFKAVHQRK